MCGIHPTNFFKVYIKNCVSQKKHSTCKILIHSTQNNYTPSQTHHSTISRCNSDLYLSNLPSKRTHHIVSLNYLRLSHSYLSLSLNIPIPSHSFLPSLLNNNIPSHSYLSLMHILFRASHSLLCSSRWAFRLSGSCSCSLLYSPYSFSYRLQSLQAVFLQ
jgi:hypothetical protein